MTFDSREKAFENKFSMDQQSLFKIEARASKLFGLWAAEKMGITGTDAESYAKEIIATNLDEPGYDDIKRRVVADFLAKKTDVSESDIDMAIEKSVATATAQIEAEKQA